MAPERSVTPEKQLLKLIEDPKSQSGAVYTQAIRHKSLGFFSLQAWASRFYFFSGKARKWLTGEEHLKVDIPAINMVLLLCITAMGCYLIYSVYTFFVNLDKTPGISLEIKKIAEPPSAAEAPLLKASSFYAEQVRQRNIFEFGKTEVTEGEKEDTAKPPSDESKEAAQYLKLVGISWSKDPDVMIEDTKSFKTYFAKRGEMIGEFKIQAIFKNKVILLHKGKEIELK